MGTRTYNIKELLLFLRFESIVVKTRQDVRRRGSRGDGHRQWIGNGQGRVRRRRRSPRRLPLRHRTPSSRLRHGRHGQQGRLRRRRGPVQERYPLLEISHRARHRYQLGRHGEGLAPHLQQRVENLPRRVPSSPLRGSSQPQEQQGEARPDRLRDLQRPRHLRVHPGRPLPLRFRSYHRYGPRHRRWCLPRRPHLRGLRPSPRHLASRLGWTRLDRLPHEDHVRERLLHGDHRRARDCPRHQGEALLRRPRLRAGDGHRRLLLCHREVLRVARWPDRHRRQRAFPLPRVHVPPIFLGYGSRRHPRGLLQRHHEVRHRHPEGSLRQHRPLRWHHHVPLYRRSYAEGDHRFGPFHHEDQDHRSSREEVLRLDRRLHLGFPLHLPGDVDLQAGVRRGWPRNRPPQMLLRTSSSSSRLDLMLDCKMLFLLLNIQLLFLLSLQSIVTLSLELNYFVVAILHSSPNLLNNS